MGMKGGGFEGRKEYLETKHKKCIQAAKGTFKREKKVPELWSLVLKLPVGQCNPILFLTRKLQMLPTINKP